MILGIKTGLQPTSIDDLTAIRPAFTEVWFNIRKKNEYTDLFTASKRLSVRTGLHFWGHTDEGLWTNIAYPDRKLIADSMALVRETIDIAALHNSLYVNIHPGCRAKVMFNFTSGEFRTVSEPIEYEQSLQIFLENACILNEYAKKRGVLFTVETVPCRVTDGWYNAGPRIIPKDVCELPSDALIIGAGRQIKIANDFGHTAAGIISESAQDIWQYLKTVSKTLAPATRLIHLGYSRKPFNGTDDHGQLDDRILETTDAVPNYNQMIQLLTLFVQKPDVYILVEPNGRHRENYILAKRILEKIGMFDR